MEKHNQTQHSGTSPPESHEIISEINIKYFEQSLPSSSSSSIAQLPPPPPPPPPQLQSQGSRIVHIPLDQVYRVLPYSTNNNPQNNHHGSSYNVSDQASDSSSQHRSGFSSSYCSRFLLIILTISIVLLVIVACIIYLALNPRSPGFFIENLTLKYPSSQNSSANNYNLYHLIRYNLTMEANNPNSRLEFYYLEGGSASLFYKKQEMANGKPPEFYNGKKDKRVFHLLLNSSSKVSPKEFAEIIMKSDDKYSKVKIPVVLLIRMPMKIKLGKLKLWKMKMKITCDVSISVSSKNNVGLGSQRCKNTIH